jgi:hypothetical protein
MIATHELVVPRSMPMILLMRKSSRSNVASGAPGTPNAKLPCATAPGFKSGARSSGPVIGAALRIKPSHPKGKRSALVWDMGIGAAAARAPLYPYGPYSRLRA